MKFFGLGGNPVEIRQEDIIKEGYLNKESRVLKNWRQ
jgi:hypothetical protein